MKLSNHKKLLVQAIVYTLASGVGIIAFILDLRQDDDFRTFRSVLFLLLMSGMAINNWYLYWMEVRHSVNRKGDGQEKMIS